jgi:hypothetical protein
VRQQGKKLAQAARLWAAGQIDNSQTDDDDEDFDSALSAFGIQPDATDDASNPAPPVEVFYLWPECLRVWSLWQRIQTLWRTGMAGRDGLDYAGLIAYLREVEHIAPRRFAETFALIQAMERAALDAWAKQQRDSK